MKLNRRYKRSIRSNLSFYIASIILTMVALLMFYLFYIAGTGIREYGEKFFEEHNIEDASFTTYMPIPEEEIEDIEKEYGVILECERYINTEEDDVTARVFARNEKIDLYEVTVGKDLSSKDEILISQGYADNMGVSVGDTVMLSGKEYTVAGLFLRPDYLYMLENTSDDYKNITTFYLAYVTDEAFEELGTANLTYKIIYGDDTDIKAFRVAVNDRYMTRTYMAATENTRITMVDEQAELFILMSWVMLVVLPFITVALISIIIGRKVKSEQKLIGTLSALGYKKSTLMWHYTLMAAIPGVFGGALTAVVSMIAAQPYGEIGLADYEPMAAKFSLSPVIAVIGILVPTIIYMLAAMIKVRKLLKHDSVELLNGTVGNNNKTHRSFIKSRMKVRYKFSFRSLIGSPARTFVVFLGIFLGAFIIAFGFIFIDSVKEVGSSAQGEMGSFAYEYILNSIQTGKPEKGEAMMVSSYEDMDGTLFSVIGVDEDCTLWNTATENGQNADLSEGWYISSLCERLLGIGTGDELTFRSTTTMKEYTVTIDGIIPNGYQSYLIGSRANVAKIMDWDADYYNVILAEQKLSLEDGIVANTISDTTFHDQMQTMLDEMGPLIDVLIVIGAVICIAAIYVAVSMMVSENATNISMLKVLGYRDHQINKLVIYANHILLVPGIALGIWLAYLTMAWYCNAFVETEELLIPATISGGNIVLTAVIVAACYFISLFFARRKVAKVDMIESLKDNRE